MSRHSVLGVGLVATALLVGCGDDGETSEGGTSPTTTVSTTVPSSLTTATTTSAPPTVPSSSTTVITSAPATVPTSTAPLGLEQPAVWPAPDVTFATPEAAAADFVSEVLGVEPALGEFRQGDSRSGEIELLSPSDGGASVVRGVLLLRQLGPHGGWFVLAVVNDNASIASPASADEVVAGPLVVEGRARGFEGNVVVTAMAAGTRSVEFDQVVTQGGALESPEPFTVTLDLSAATPGDTVMLLVRGGTGSDTDPGEVGAIPVTIAA
jgi:hypothetical protein